jgi:hypothetical protein
VRKNRKELITNPKGKYFAYSGGINRIQELPEDT